MLQKQYRLKNPKAFLATYKNKNTVGNRYVTIYRGKLKEDKNTTTRVGIVVSKKYHKRAVKRNKIKRLFREAYIQLLKTGKIKKSEEYLSLIFVIKQECLNTNYAEICDFLSVLLNL